MNKVQGVAAAYLVISLLIFWGFAVGKYQVFPYHLFIKNSPVPSIDTDHPPESAFKEINKAIVKITGKPVDHITEAQPRLSSPVNGTTDLKDKNILVASWFNNRNTLRLINAKGKGLKDWTFDFNKAFPNKKRDDSNIDLGGFAAETDGSVIANFEYYGLVKIDKCNNVIWTLHSTHHSIFYTPRHTYWVPGNKNRNTPIKTLVPPIGEDFLLEINNNGKVIRSISLLDILFANDLQG